ncbi:DUF6090 family protein [Algoriphagus namhaensis]|uniref:DUF6090 family protein n=1 Tax=Algoriphagus namhaensis TaxID=915353 RepID=A0ABV8ATI5_9BACT
MLKIFRKIRQDLLSEGKTAKYLKYAIGEIVLVVIGILIALQINNWNESRKERRIESNILNEILVNLEDDLENLDLKIEETSTFLTHSSKVLEHLQNQTPITDSLQYHYSALIGHGNFEPTLIAYENLSNIGIDIIQNKELRQAISELYSIKYYAIVEDRRTVVRRFQENQVLLIQNKIKIYENYRKAEPINLEELRNDIPFQNMLTTNIWILNWVIGRYEKGKEEIKIVQGQIRKELEK